MEPQTFGINKLVLFPDNKLAPAHKVEANSQNMDQLPSQNLVEKGEDSKSPPLYEQLPYGDAIQKNVLSHIKQEILSKQLIESLEHSNINEISSEEKQFLSKSITALACTLTQKLFNQKSKSLCIAPISIAPILGMILKSISDPQDKKNFLAAFHCEDIKEERFHRILNSLIREISLSDSVNQTEIKIANGLAVADKPSEAFTETMREIYRAEIFSTSMMPEKAVEVVNAWIAEKTDGKIPHLLPSNTDLTTGVAMLNAIAFSAVWNEPFDKSSTFEYAFECLDGTKVNVMLMKKKKAFKFAELDDLQFLELPYKSSSKRSLSQLIILPRKDKTLLQVMNKLTPEYIEDLRQRAKKTMVRVSLPRLEVKYANNLLPALLQMGFPLDKPLTNISPKDTLSLIQHEVKLSSDEAGTRGAAATAAITYRGGDDTPVFSATRPFCYFIMDGMTALFQGIVSDASVLVSKEQARILDQQEDLKLINAVNTDTLTLAAASTFLEKNSDLQPLLQLIPANVDRLQVHVLSQRVPKPKGNGCTKFDIVNYTDMELRFDANYRLRLNNNFIPKDGDYARKVNFTTSDCQLVFYKKGHQLFLLDKDIGAEKIGCLLLEESKFDKGIFPFKRITTLEL